MTTTIYGLRRMFGVEEFGVSRVLRRMNDCKTERPPLHTEMQKELVSAFAGEVNQLSQILGRDLSHWLSC